MSACTVFYSWQSDLPNKTNRSFIQSALEKAVKKIKEDDSIKVEPVIERGAEGVPGCPDIGLTILDKIKKATVFVADVSIVAVFGNDKHTPNPNVLVELGYALGTIGWSRVILVMNKAYGQPERLPFDLRQKLALVYESKEEDTERSEARKKLEGMLESALRAIFADIEILPVTPAQPSLADLVIRSVEDGKPDGRSRAEQFVQQLVADLDEIAPDLAKCDLETIDELLIEGIDASLPLVTRFGEVVNAIASSGSEEASLGLWHGLSALLERYELPANQSGHSRTVQFDFHRFVGNECFLMVIASLLRGHQWELLIALLDEELSVSNRRAIYGSTVVPASYAQSPIRLLDHRNEKRKLGRISLHADILHSRHTRGELAEVSPFVLIQDADLLLAIRFIGPEPYLRSSASWYPITSVYQSVGTPRFLLEAAKMPKALRLGKALGFKGSPQAVVAEIRNAVEAVRKLASEMWGFHGDVEILTRFDCNTIGTKA